MYQSKLFLATVVAVSLIVPASVFAQNTSSTATTATSTVSTTSPMISTSTTATSTNIAALLVQINILRNQLALLVKQVIDLGGYASSTDAYREKNVAAVSVATAKVCPSFSRSMSLGMRGDDIKAMQQVLLTLDSTFPKDAVTGYFGQKTYDAVKRLQQKTGVVVPTGFVGSTTVQMIKRFCEGAGTLGALGSSTSSTSIATSSDDTAKIDR